jgi:lysozyme
MKTSAKGIALIKKWESLHDGDLSKTGLQPKMDAVGIWTEGWGRAMRDSKGKFIKGPANKALAYSRISIHTAAEADAALEHDIKPFELQVLRNVKRDLAQNEFDALVVHTYNTGGSSTLFDLVDQNAPDEQIKTWWTIIYIKAQGVKLRGLINRRKEEADLYFS